MITIHPADGLINRLLQQQNPRSKSRMSLVGAESSSTAAGQAEDSSVQQHTGERELEAQLLQLYRANVRPKENP